MERRDARLERRDALRHRRDALLERQGALRRRWDLRLDRRDALLGRHVYKDLLSLHLLWRLL